MTRIAQKVAHVKRARQGASQHHCHWPGCTRLVPPAKWGCVRHWFMLPAELRDAIWRAYQPGQETTKTPSREYVDIARQVQDWIAKNHPTRQERLL